MATAVSTQLSALTGSNTVQQMMSDVNSLKTLSALATDAAGSGDFVPTTGGTFTGNVGIEKNGATTLTLTRTNGASNFAEIEAAGSNGEQLTIKSNVSNQTGGFTAFDVGGSERMRIDSSGNVGIGTSSPINGGRYLDITNTNGVATDFSILRLITQEVGSSSTTSADLFKRKNGQLTLSNNDTDPVAYLSLQVGASERMRIDSDGKVGIGTSSPTGKFEVSGSLGSVRINNSGDQLSFTNNGFNYITAPGNSAHLRLNAPGTNGTLSFSAGGSERMRIASDGDITFKQGVVNLESASGNPAQMNFYCESGNAHYTRLQSAPHASYSGNVVLTLPTTSGTLATTASVATTGKSIAMAIVFG